MNASSVDITQERPELSDLLDLDSQALCMCRYLEPFDALSFCARWTILYNSSANKTNMFGSETIYSVPESNFHSLPISIYKSSANPSFQSKFMSIGLENEKTDTKRFSLLPV